MPLPISRRACTKEAKSRGHRKFIEDREDLETASQLLLSEMTQSPGRPSLADVETVEDLDLVNRSLDLDARALKDLLDWNPINPLFGSDIDDCEPYGVSDGWHLQITDAISQQAKMDLHHLSQSIPLKLHPRTEGLLASKEKAFLLSESQESPSSSSRSYSIPSASSESCSNRTQSSSQIEQEEAEVDPNDES